MPAIEVDELLEFLQEKKKRHELDEAIDSRKITAAQIREAMSEASDEDKAELRRFLGIVEDQEPEPPTPKAEEEPKKPKKRAPAKQEEKAEPRTRPGRKPGAAYDWDVDEDGEVIQLNYAKVYSGESEPDKVEIPEKSTDDGSDEDDANETD